MGTSVYPGALDNFAEASPPYLADDDTTGRDHPARHDDLEAAMEAVQGELGTDPSGGSATVKARLDAADSTLAGKAPLDSPAFTGTVNFTGTSVIGLPVAGLSASPPSSVANSGGTASLSGNTVTFTGVSSVSLNGCFTGEYDNYRVLVRLVSASATQSAWNMRLRSSGTDNTASSYNSQELLAYLATVTASVNNAETSWNGAWPVSNSTSQADTATIDIFRPSVAAYTNMLQQNYGYQSNVSAWLLRSGGHQHQVASSFDGFSLYLGAGYGITGTISVYGYKK